MKQAMGMKSIFFIWSILCFISDTHQSALPLPAVSGKCCAERSGRRCIVDTYMEDDCYYANCTHNRICLDPVQVHSSTVSWDEIRDCLLTRFECVCARGRTGADCSQSYTVGSDNLSFDYEGHHYFILSGSDRQAEMSHTEAVELCKVNGGSLIQFFNDDRELRSNVFTAFKDFLTSTISRQDNPNSSSDDDQRSGIASVKVQFHVAGNVKLDENTSTIANQVEINVPDIDPSPESMYSTEIPEGYGCAVFSRFNSTESDQSDINSHSRVVFGLTSLAPSLCQEKVALALCQKDKNECLNTVCSCSSLATEAGCQSKCTDTAVDHVCGCPESFSLGEDKSTCLTACEAHPGVCTSKDTAATCSYSNDPTGATPYFDCSCSQTWSGDLCDTPAQSDRNCIDPNDQNGCQDQRKDTAKSFQSCASCSEFVKCASGHGPQRMSCPSGLQFDYNKQYCDWKSETCVSQGQGQSDTNNVPDEAHCEVYKDTDGTMFVCPYLQLFDITTNQCVNFAQATCNPGSSFFSTPCDYTSFCYDNDLTPDTTLIADNTGRNKHYNRHGGNPGPPCAVYLPPCPEDYTGQHEWMWREGSPLYIMCHTGFTVSFERCPNGLYCVEADVCSNSWDWEGCDRSCMRPGDVGCIPDKLYNSCGNCNSYIPCTDDAKAGPVMPCPRAGPDSKLEFDGEKQACDFVSTTCPEPEIGNLMQVNQMPNA